MAHRPFGVQIGLTEAVGCVKILEVLEVFWIMKIGFSLQPRYDRPLEQVMELLEKEGFSAVSPVWSAELNVESLLAAANRLGMKIQSLHTPHGFNATLWEPSNPLCRKTADEN